MVESWQDVMGEAMRVEEGDMVGAHKLYREASIHALAEMQSMMNQNEIVPQAMEVLYGAVIAYSQQTMMRFLAEDPEAGGVDHAFRVGQAYGVSCVLNHLIDQLVDIKDGTNLRELDDFSDKVHDEITLQAKAAGLTIELLDAKGNLLD